MYHEAAKMVDAGLTHPSDSSNPYSGFDQACDDFFEFLKAMSSSEETKVKVEQYFRGKIASCEVSF